MSFARAAVLSRQRPSMTLVFKRKNSPSAHTHDKLHQDEPLFRKEGFSSSFWRNSIIISLIVVGAYKYAPEPTNETYLTRWIAFYSTPRDRWLDIAAKHTAMSVDESEVNLLVTNAKKPVVHRYRYVQLFEQASPFLMPVGGSMNTSNLVIKGAKD